MTAVSAWQGAATPSSIRVRTQVTGSSTRLLVADNQGLTGAAAVGPVVPTADGIATLDATGLDPSTSYWWAVEDDGVLDEEFRGQFRTYPPVGEPASFNFAAATCAQGFEVPGVGAVLAADRISNHPVFSTIRTHSHDPLFFWHGGDLHYYDLGSDNHGIVGGGSLANYLRAYEDVLLQPHQHQLYREVPLVLSCGGGGHDWGQPVGLGGTLPARNEVLRAYRERVPHYPTASPSTTAGTYHSFQVGRVLFVVTDENADRNPDADPEGPNKTKLGAAQKSWLIGELTNTTAEVLVWLSGAQWHRTGAANWGNYTTERAELIQIFGDLGWLPHMAFITGDRHALELIRAGDNPLGGFPIWHFASMDSEANPLATPGSPGANRYGTVQVVDTGTRITLTGSGWIGNSLWGQDLLTVQTSGVTPPPPGPSPAPVAQGEIQKRAVTWYGVNAVTGRIIAELPDMRGEVSRLLSAYRSASLTMPIPLKGSPGHVPIPLVEQATAPIDTAIVAVVNKLPTWMGWVLAREGGTDAQATLACITPEGYLIRRRVRDHAFTQVDRAEVAAALIGDAEALVGTGGSGLGFTLVVTLTGDLIDREYLATDRATVYDALRELAADGLEFTVDLDWADETLTSVRKILRIGPRIGVDTGAVLFEATATSMFESEAGSEATYRLTEDFATDRYGNYVVAYASGEGEDQPASAPAVDQAALFGGTPIVEHHFQATVVEQNALDRLAAAELARLRTGGQVFEISSRIDAYPRPGVDAQIGDDVSWSLTGHRHPTGVLGVGRMLGYTIDQQAGRWRPILLQPGGEVVS